jgi:hypothetical protein
LEIFLIADLPLIIQYYSGVRNPAADILGDGVGTVRYALSARKDDHTELLDCPFPNITRM